MSIWYYVEGGERRGPVEEELLRQQFERGMLAPDTLVWRDGMTDWVPANGLPEFSSGAAAANAPLAAAPEAAESGYDPYSQEHYGVQYVTYAGFWKRFVAWFIDRIILAVVGGCFGGIVGGILGGIAGAGGVDVEDPNFAMAFQVIGGIVGTLIGWLYYAFFESSEYQATPGKMALQIKVTDMSGNRISFARATGRYFGKILSTLTFLVGYIMAGFTEKKQALHDMIAGCLVVNK